MKIIYRLTAPMHIYEPQHVRGPITKDFDNLIDALCLQARIKKVVELDYYPEPLKESQWKFIELVYEDLNARGIGCLTQPAYIDRITTERL